MLIDCPVVWGYASILKQDPRIEVHDDVLFVPGGAGGLFDRGRRLIAGSGYYRGLRSTLGIIDLVHGSVFSPVDPDEVHEYFDDPVVFGGVLLDHFGHFLVGTLSRWWNSGYRSGWRHAVINGGDLRAVLALPIYQAILPSIGLAPSDFVNFDRPIRMRQAVVVYPSFEENNLAHITYGRLCAEVVNGLEKSVNASTPIFLSKVKVTSGITCVENEEELCEKLAARGVRLVYPETLTFAEQVSLFRASPAISGFMGSAFHLSAFAPGCNLMAINHSPEIISNQVMIDRVCGNRARYVFGEDTFTALGPSGNFHRTFRLNNVDQTYTDLMRYYDGSGHIS